MKISLITACFRSAGMLRTALDSVLEQKGVDLDYIVVDGGSDDGTVELLKEYEAKFADRMRWISEKDRGMYDSINKGARWRRGMSLGFSMPMMCWRRQTRLLILWMVLTV